MSVLNIVEIVKEYAETNDKAKEYADSASKLNKLIKEHMRENNCNEIISVS